MIQQIWTLLQNLMRLARVKLLSSGIVPTASLKVMQRGALQTAMHCYSASPVTDRGLSPAAMVHQAKFLKVNALQT